MEWGSPPFSAMCAAIACVGNVPAGTAEAATWRVVGQPTAAPSQTASHCGPRLPRLGLHLGLGWAYSIEQVFLEEPRGGRGGARR